MATDERTTSYSIILYPDSCDVEDVRTVLRKRHIRAMLSPLHDHDKVDRVDTENWDARAKSDELSEDEQQRPEIGQYKKPHWHLLVNFGKQKKSRLQVLAIVHEFSPTTKYAEPVHDLQQLTRYACHLDDKHKTQYPVEMCESFGGFDLSPLYETSKGARRSALSRLCRWCSDYGIYNLEELTRVVLELDEPALFDAVVERSHFLTHYLSGLRERVNAGGAYSFDAAGIASAIKRDLVGDAPTIEKKAA